jgi:hypothetical protein
MHLLTHQCETNSFSISFETSKEKTNKQTNKNPNKRTHKTYNIISRHKAVVQ